MKVAFRSFSRFISISALGVSSLLAAEPTPGGLAMESLIGMPYRLFARQGETDTRQALNCFTSVMDALSRLGVPCPKMNFKQGFAFWWPRGKELRLGETPIDGRDMLLLTRSHFLLLHTDRNENGVVDEDDLVIHAYFRPVEITTIKAWLQESRREEIRYLSVDDAFVCPTRAELGRLHLSRR
jgi:hypothetical protein